MANMSIDSVVRWAYTPNGSKWNYLMAYGHHIVAIVILMMSMVMTSAMTVIKPDHTRTMD